MHRFANAINNVFRVAKYQAVLQGVYYGVAMGSGNLGMLTVLYYGGHYVNEVSGDILQTVSLCWRVSADPICIPQGLITLGDLSSMLLYSVYAGFSISALVSYYGELMKAAGSAERIFNLMEHDR